MTEPENEIIGNTDEGDEDSSLILAAEIRRLLPVLREIATALKNTSERFTKIEAALSPSRHATSLFEALRLINMSIDTLWIIHGRPLTREEREVLDMLYPEGKQ